MSQSYTREQRVAAMKAAGWPTDVIPVGVAVSLAESWDGKGINNTPNPLPGNSPEYSVGPWQINLLAHPEVKESQALDLNYSTNYALHLWQAHGFQPWGAYTSGAYLKYLEPGVAAPFIPLPMQPNGGSTKAVVNVQSPDAVDRNKVTTANPVAALSGFQFPTLDLGPWKIDSSPLFKVALSVGALFLLFTGIKSMSEG